MISLNDFTKIDNEVKDALYEAFDFIRKNRPDHDYILFLADGEYKEKYDHKNIRLNPYVIENQEDKYKDETRLNFFIEFMRLNYAFSAGNTIIDDNEYRLTMELMIYSHIWESKPFLRQLYRLASLAKGDKYTWSVEVPEMSKHLFIRNEIRNELKAAKLQLANIITNGFHTSLRNAFAHSEYNLDDKNNLIHLDTFKGDTSWDIPNISFDEWTKKFSYSALLSYHFIEVKKEMRKKVISDFGTNKFLIVHPLTKSKSKIQTIYYDEHHDRFHF